MFTIYQHFLYLCFNTILFKAVVRLGGSMFKEKCKGVLRQFLSQVSREKSKANDDKIWNQDIFEPIHQDENKTSCELYRCSCQGEHNNIAVLYINSLNVHSNKKFNDL